MAAVTAMTSVASMAAVSFNAVIVSSPYAVPYFIYGKDIIMHRWIA
jgi:hypothetical protein